MARSYVSPIAELMTDAVITIDERSQFSCFAYLISLEQSLDFASPYSEFM
jgi:hypothetical protein